MPINVVMNNTTHKSVLIIGAGNMGKSIAQGLLAKQWPAKLITFCDHAITRHADLNKEFSGCQVVASPQELNETPNVVVLAVKPHDMASTCESLAMHDDLNQRLFITVAAGVPVSAYKTWLGTSATIIRCMPNTPAAIGMAITGLYTEQSTSNEDRSIAEHIIKAIGKTVWLNKESMLDAVTALSGSGPAYVFYLMECLQKSGVSLGLSEDQSYQLTLQTILGAAQLASHQGIDFETLRANVTSKGGTTEQAINCFQDNNLDQIVEHALIAAAQRAEQISQSFDHDDDDANNTKE